MLSKKTTNQAPVQTPAGQVSTHKEMCFDWLKCGRKIFKGFFATFLNFLLFSFHFFRFHAIKDVFMSQITQTCLSLFEQKNLRHQRWFCCHEQKIRSVSLRKIMVWGIAILKLQFVPIRWHVCLCITNEECVLDSSSQKQSFCRCPSELHKGHFLSYFIAQFVCILFSICLTGGHLQSYKSSKKEILSFFAFSQSV